MTEITINLHDEPCQSCTICIGRRLGAKQEQERIIKLLEEFNYGKAEDIAKFLQGPLSPEHDWCNTCRCWAYAPKGDYRRCKCI